MATQPSRHPLIDPLHLRRSALLWIAVLWVGSHVVQPRESWDVEHCKDVVGVDLIDDASSIERWQVSADPIWADSANEPIIGWDWAGRGEPPLKPRRTEVELRFRHLDRTGHPRLKDVVCTFVRDTLVFLTVDDETIPVEDGYPSFEYVNGPEYMHLR
jgi:hypothetical protein